MINIRYHIVSITAVFLALGIGIALGSTFLDGATVDVLNRNITDAETRIRDANTKIDELEGEVEDAQARDDALILVGTDRLLDDTLTDQTVLVVAEPGVDDQEVDALRSVLERSGADLRGTLALSDRLAFADDTDADLADDLGLDDPTATELRDEVDQALTEALAAAAAPTPEEPEAPEVPTTTTTTAPGTPTTTAPGATTTTVPATTTTTVAEEPVDPSAPDGSTPDAVQALLERGYLDLTPGPGYEDDDPILETTGYRYVYVGSRAPDPASTEVLFALLPTEEEGATLPAIVVAGTQDPPAEGEDQVPTVVARVRADDARAKAYSTVDDIDTFAGLAATVFSVADLGSVPVGHYGQADGASAVLPPSP